MSTLDVYAPWLLMGFFFLCGVAAFIAGGVFKNNGGGK